MLVEIDDNTVRAIEKICKITGGSFDEELRKAAKDRRILLRKVKTGHRVVLESSQGWTIHRSDFELS